MNPPARTTGVYGPRGVGARGGKTRWMLMRVRRSSYGAQAGARRRRAWRAAYALAYSSAWAVEDWARRWSAALRRRAAAHLPRLRARLRRPVAAARRAGRIRPRDTPACPGLHAAPTGPPSCPGHS